MSSILIITQKVDVRDEAMGFFPVWLKRIASHFGHVYVIAGSVGEHDLKGNITVISMGRERGYGSFRRYATLTYELVKLLPKVDGIFAHMSPSFAIAAWPALLFRKPIVMWYAHVFSNTRKLRLATRMCHRVLSISQETFPFDTTKLLVTGHGIDVGQFSCQSKTSTKLLRLVTVNRISRVKELEVLIDAMRVVRDRYPDVQATLCIVGSAYIRSDEEYHRLLLRRVRENGLSELVMFEGGLENSRVAQRYSAADVVISSQRLGGLNKSTLEGMACGCIPAVPIQGSPLVSPGVDAQLMYEQGNSTACAEVIARIARLSDDQRTTLSQTAREAIVSHHNLDTLATTIARQFVIP